MKIRYIGSDQKSPTLGSLNKGRILEVDNDLGKGLIDRGMWEEVKKKEEKKKEEKKEEKVKKSKLVEMDLKEIKVEEEVNK